MTWRGLDAVWPVYAIAAASSAVGAFDLPARQSLIPNLVPREHLANALTLNTIMFQVAAVAGPALGGIVIGQLGVAWAYAFNALSFLVVIVALLMMRGVSARSLPRRSRQAAAERREEDGVHDSRGHGRPAVRVPRAAHPIDDAARFLRDVLLVGDGAAAALRAGHPRRGGERLRLALRGAGGGRDSHQRHHGQGGRRRSTIAARSWWRP